ncbi:MAG: NAD(P)-dependent oxidoreductase [Thermoplasmatales archaeon]
MGSMKILIVGANGFVGANLTRYMLEKGFEVIALVRPKKQLWRLSDVGHRITTVYGDITDSESIHKILLEIKPDGIINTAIYGGYRYQNNEDLIFNVNLNGTRILLDEAIKTGFDWFINTGSSSEYGEKKTLMHESDVAEPIDSYGISKLAGSLYCRSMAKKLSLPIVTLRLFSIYGYLEEPKRLIPHLMVSKLKGKIPQLSSPSSVRDFTFIEDVCDAYRQAIIHHSDLDYGEIFNIGTGTSTKIFEVVNTLSSIFDHEFEVNWRFEQGKISDNYSLWAADITKAKKLLSWEPMNDLKAGLTKTYNWFEKNWANYKKWYDE